MKIGKKVYHKNFMHIEKRFHPYTAKLLGVEQFKKAGFADTIFALDQYALSPVDPVVYRRQVRYAAFIVYKILFSLHRAYLNQRAV
jgi:hypothetical protein